MTKLFFKTKKVEKDKVFLCRVNGDNFIGEIISYCDLVSIEKNKHLKRTWIDLFGSTIKFNFKAPVEIKHGAIIKPEYGNLYSGLSFDNVLKLTEKMCIVKDNDFTLYNCMCIDMKIRSFLFMNDKIYKVSSLLLGYENLKEFIKNKNILHWYSRKTNLFNSSEQDIYFSIYPFPNDLLGKF